MDASASPDASGRIARRLKRSLVALPVMSFGFAATQLHAMGHSVERSVDATTVADVFAATVSAPRHKTLNNAPNTDERTTAAVADDHFALVPVSSRDQ